MKRQYIAAIVAVLMLLCIGCALNSTALKPSQELLVRMETFYMAQFNDYQVQVAQPGLTAQQKDTLRTKREVLVKAEPLLKMYGATVYAGGTPDLATEQQLIALLNSIGGGF